MNNIYIASDHAGFVLKEYIHSGYSKFVNNNQKLNELIDLGTFSESACDYPIIANELVTKMKSDKASRGILICGSGIGMSIVANRHIEIRAALCWCAEVAELSRKHNDANLLILPARFIESSKSIDIIDTFFSTDFSGEKRHIDRINLIDNDKGV